MGVISLLVLAAVIVISYKRSINPGLLGVAASFFLGFFLFTETKTGALVPISSAAGGVRMLIAGWSSRMFLMLFGVTFLFGIAKANKTLDILTRKLVSFAGGNTALLPILVFLISFIIAVIGPGPVNGSAIVAPIAVAIAFREKLSPLLMLMSSFCGNMAGGLAPLTPSGMVAVTYAQQGGTDIGYNLLLNMVIAFTLIFAVLYVIFRGWKRQEVHTESEAEETVHLKKENWVTLVGILAAIFCIIALKLDVGITTFSAAVILLMLGIANEKEAIAQVPWNMILMVCGMGVLVSLVGYAGGIEYLVNLLMPMINTSTAAPIMMISGALMSAVASASGVVMPTLIPTASMLAANLNLDPRPLIYGVVMGSHLSSISPFSKIGALSLGALGADYDTKHMFVYLLGMAIGLTIIGAILVYFKILLYF